MFSPEAASEDRRRLEQGRLHDPFRFLGRHELGGGDIVIRAFLPGAGRAWIVEGGRPMTRAGEGDVFEWSGSPEGLPARYTIGAEVDGVETASVDPYAFPPQLAEGDLDGFGRGEHFRAHRFMGSRCHVADGVEGALFAVWAPEAERVSVVGNFNRWDGRRHPMRGRGRSGIWELFVPGLGAGDLYKYELRNRSTAEILVKSDPFARVAELRPRTASIVPAPADFTWTDADWMTRRAAWDWQAGPISIYEVHAGSWRRGGNGRFLTYREMADLLADELRGLGFTHVEFLPLTEHPLDASWGYQTSGYFAPTSRHGSPDDLRYLVDRLHGAGIGIILDWVPGHFPTDEHALARFDGSCLYEYADTRKGTHREWGTLVFNFGRNEVRSFLISSAAYWMEEFHVDGLRVDAVASMLYLDYSRGHGEWAPNPFGGNEHLEAIDFLKRFNEVTHGQFPGTITIAEESTAWPGVTRPTWDGGLGFSLKWNMGWMHDTLEYMTEDPVHRRHHHDRITFGAMYAFSENFVLPLSHDEVVHGKRSLLGRMPGDEWQRLANLRLLYAFQWTFPGKKLLFMGSEVAQAGEWDHSRALPAPGPGGNAVRRLVSDLNAMYRREPALHAGDLRQDGFEWLRWDDASSSVLAYLRRSGGEEIVVLLNFTPVPRHGYRVGVTSAGSFVEILNSDSRFYGGSDIGNPGELFAAEIPSMGRSWSFVANLPPLAGVVFRRTC